MKKKVLMTISLILIILIVFVYGVIRYASAPMKQAQEETIEIASKYADLKSYTNFYWYHHVNTYYTLFGQNSKKEKVVVIVAKKGGDTTILNQADGITESEATQIVTKAKNPRKILHTSFGFYKKKPVWEITYEAQNGTLGYYTLTFAHGETMQVIENI